MRRLVLAGTLVAAACASAPPRLPAPDPAIAAAAEATALRQRLIAANAVADARVLAGCYRCLREARSAYENAAAVADLRAAVVQRIFEVNLLLALREKELAMDSGESIRRAHAIAVELLPDVAADAALAIVEAIPPDDLGTPRAVAAKFNLRAAAVAMGRWQTSLHAGTISAVVGRYLDLSIECALPGRVTRAEPAPAVQPPPLIASHLGICPINASILQSVKGAVPEFVETAYFLGRAEMNNVDEHGPGRALGLLSEAHGAFPASPSISSAAGILDLAIEDYAPAVHDYDAAIAAAPSLETAWLGRTQAHFFLNQLDDAIADATSLIAAGERVPEAYYWRARSRHAGRDLAGARSDIDAARQLSTASDVLTLAGIIEYDQRELPSAEHDLTVVRTRDQQLLNCPSRWYLGFTEEALGHRAEAASAFAESMACYEHDVSRNSDRRDEVAANRELDAAYQAQALARLDQRIAEGRSQQSSSAYNAAVNYLGVGDKADATKFADLAAKDPARAAVVDALRKLILLWRFQPTFSRSR